MKKSNKKSLFILWFRKNIRIQDQPLLDHMIKNQKSTYFLPLYIIRESFIDSDTISANRFGFLLECISDLNLSFQRQFRHKVVFLRGTYIDCIRALIEHIHRSFPELQNNISLGWETSSDREIMNIDTQVSQFCAQQNINQINVNSSTLWNSEEIMKLSRENRPQNMPEFLKLIELLPPPIEPVPIPKKLPPPIENFFLSFSADMSEETCSTEPFQIKLSSNVTYYFNSPKFEDFGSAFNEDEHRTSIEGGEKKALKIFNKLLKNQNTVLNFKKSKQNPASLRPESTLLSPYINMGCLSVRYFFAKVSKIYDFNKYSGKVEDSLLGQLYWREFFHVMGSLELVIPKNSKGAESANSIPSKNKYYAAAWEHGRTGYPTIGRTRDRPGHAETLTIRCDHAAASARGLDPPLLQNPGGLLFDSKGAQAELASGKGRLRQVPAGHGLVHQRRELEVLWHQKEGFVELGQALLADRLLQKVRPRRKLRAQLPACSEECASRVHLRAVEHAPPNSKGNRDIHREGLSEAHRECAQCGAIPPAVF